MHFCHLYVFFLCNVFFYSKLKTKPLYFGNCVCFVFCTYVAKKANSIFFLKKKYVIDKMLASAQLFSQHYKIVKQRLACSSHSAVIALAESKDGPVAIKTIAIDNSEKNMWLARGEIDMHLALDQPGIRHYFVLAECYCINNEFFRMAMPFYRHGDLFTFLSSHFSADNLMVQHQNMTRGVALQMVMCLEAMHSLDFAHRDVKLENFLIDDDGRIRLCDFEYSSKVDQCQLLTCGTCCVAAPEVFKEDPKNDTVSDMWSFAASLYEMVTYKMPYADRFKSNLSIMEFLANVTNQLYVDKVFRRSTGEMDTLLEDILRTNLVINRSERLTAKQVIALLQDQCIIQTCCIQMLRLQATIGK